MVSRWLKKGLEFWFHIDHLDNSLLSTWTFIVINKSIHVNDPLIYACGDFLPQDRLFFPGVPKLQHSNVGWKPGVPLHPCEIPHLHRNQSSSPKPVYESNKYISRGLHTLPAYNCSSLPIKLLISACILQASSGSTKRHSGSLSEF